MKWSSGASFPDLALENVHGRLVAIPDKASQCVHLQFRRFAGCPICNLHLRTFVKRHPELEEAGIHEVVVFHSPKESLLPFQGSFPFDVIGDPKKALYQRFGVETSVLAILNPKVWSTIFKANAAKDKPRGGAEGGPLGLPADFLVSSDGRLVASHYGTHASDQWSVDDVLALARKHGGEKQKSTRHA
jgi:peroxiredoxin